MIVNTLICTTLNPLNPLQSKIMPYVSVTESKTDIMNGTEKQSDMVNEAISTATDHLNTVFNKNYDEIYGIKTPQNKSNLL